MALVLNSGPSVEPLTLLEVKNHLRLDASDNTEDDLLNALITAARQDCEKFQGRAYITQTWELWLDAFPGQDFIKLNKSPVQSVSSIKYYDTDDTEATFSSDDYFVDTKSEPGRVVLNYSESWPSTTLRPANGVCVTFVAGYGDAASDVPQYIKNAMLLLIGHLYENREAVITGMTAAQMPFGVEALLWKERVF